MPGDGELIVSGITHPTAVQRWFSLLAPSYDHVVTPLFWPESLQRRALEGLDIEPDDRVLDLGCGTGETSRLLREFGATVDGVDLSIDQLESAQAKVDNVQLLQADGAQLPCSETVYDHVVSVGSMLYWPEPETVLAEAARVTKPGGSILLMGFHRRTLRPWTPLRNTQELLAAPLFERHTTDESQSLFEIAGWSEIQQTVTGPLWCPDLVLETVARQPQ